MRIRLFEEYSEVLYSPMLMSDWLTKIYDPMKGMMGSLYEIEKFTDSEKDLMKKTLEILHSKRSQEHLLKAKNR